MVTLLLPRFACADEGAPDMTQNDLIAPREIRSRAQYQLQIISMPRSAKLRAGVATPFARAANLARLAPETVATLLASGVQSAAPCASGSLSSRHS
jgi:hypothetical protein